MSADKEKAPQSTDRGKQDFAARGFKAALQVCPPVFCPVAIVKIGAMDANSSKGNARI